jgi:hypothetical protein
MDAVFCVFFPCFFFIVTAGNLKGVLESDSSALSLSLSLYIYIHIYIKLFLNYFLF